MFEGADPRHDQRTRFLGYGDVHVLARVEESTYSPDTPTKMGDHPVVWTNEHYKARNIYIFMGHHPELFQNPAFTTLFTNSIFWAARQ